MAMVMVMAMAMVTATDMVMDMVIMDTTDKTSIDVNVKMKYPLNSFLI